MRLLLDENLPKRLKLDFLEHEVYTVRDKGWNGVKNGQLLKLLIENGFDALLTFDKNLQYQQNFSKYSVAVFVLSAWINKYEVLKTLVPQIKNYLHKNVLPSGAVVIQMPTAPPQG